jgi:hypothetical protein
MKIEITEYEKRYTFELCPITQLCGQNVITKNYIIESIKRYFSTFKYSELYNKWRDNVTVDDKVVGRKFFSVISVKDVQELILDIKWSKQSMLTDYIKQLLLDFDYQMHLQLINEEVERMFLLLNDRIAQIGDVELTYAPADVWDMVQKTNVMGQNNEPLEDKDYYELIIIFLNLIEEIMKYNPKKSLIIFENLDHFLSRTEYFRVVGKLKNITACFNIYFILTTSLNNYVVCEPELCEGISVFGDENFQMTNYENLSHYIHENYPSNKVFNDEKLQRILEKIIQNIGKNSYLTGIEENVICKLINQSLLINDKWTENENAPEIAFLKS